jgi:hypothetical protein
VAVPVVKKNDLCPAIATLLPKISPNQDVPFVYVPQHLVNWFNELNLNPIGISAVVLKKYTCLSPSCLLLVKNQFSPFLAGLLTVNIDIILLFTTLAVSI